MAEVTRGYLIITVEEATGKTQRDQFTWDTNAGAFEAFVKGECSKAPAARRKQGVLARQQHAGGR